MKRDLVGAEIIGTFLLVFAGCGAVVVNDLYGGVLGHLGISTVFGLVVMAVIYSLGSVSGAHINPAVTIGFWMAGRLKGQLIPQYIGAQILGAVAAGLLLRILFPEHTTLGATLPAIDIPRAFLLEVVISFALMLIILNVSTGELEKGIMAGAAVGGMVALLALVAGPVTGASMNPARSLGPAVAAGNLTSLWIYLFAPVLGTCLATQCCRLMDSNCCPREVSAA